MFAATQRISRATCFQGAFDRSANKERAVYEPFPRTLRPNVVSVQILRLQRIDYNSKQPT